MKELVLRFLRYNVWANARFIAMLRSLGDERLDMEITSSFPDIRKTVNHMWGAEDIWLQRLQKLEKVEWKVPSFKGDIQEACDIWEAASAGLLSYAEQLTEAGFTETISVVTMKGEGHDDVIADVLLHVVNHASYHPGQLVTMLRQAGIMAMPSTDFFVYTRGGG